MIDRIEATFDCSVGDPFAYHTLDDGNKVWYCTFAVRGKSSVPHPGLGTPIIWGAEEDKLCEAILQMLFDWAKLKLTAERKRLFWRYADKVRIESYGSTYHQIRMRVGIEGIEPSVHDSYEGKLPQLVI